jgi:BolA protein
VTEVVIGDASTRIERIRAALAVLTPTGIELIDESHEHVGHAGARDGRGHYALKITSEAFRGVGAVASHRKVYTALGDLMQTDIHALSIVASVPEAAAG